MENIKERQPETEIESELSPEEIERFESILGDATEDKFMADNISYDRFYAMYQHFHYGAKIEAIESRKIWLAMKKEGERFEKFITAKIRKCEENVLYRTLLIYKNLGYKNSPEVLGELLNQFSVWGNRDSSAAHSILEFLENFGSEKSVDAIIQYLQKIGLPDYPRQEFRVFDFYKAVIALKALLGSKTAAVLTQLAIEDATFAGWFMKNEAAVLSEKTFSVSPAKLKVEEFDAKKEEERIRLLELDLPEQKRAEEKTLWEERKKAEERETLGREWWEEEVRGTSQEEIWGAIDEPRQLLEQNAARWEKGELINFYGRFRPKLENGIGITPENHLAGLTAVARLAAEKGEAGIEDYLNFLAGVMRPELGEAEPLLPENLTVEDAYRIAALATARSYSVGVLEGRASDAAGEVRGVINFLNAAAEKASNSQNKWFLEKFQ